MATRHAARIRSSRGPSNGREGASVACAIGTQAGRSSVTGSGLDTTDRLNPCMRPSTSKPSPDRQSCQSMYLSVYISVYMRASGPS